MFEQILKGLNDVVNQMYIRCAIEQNSNEFLVVYICTVCSLKLCSVIHFLKGFGEGKHLIECSLYSPKEIMKQWKVKNTVN